MLFFSLLLDYKNIILIKDNMLDKNNIKHFIKYIIMFMVIILTTYIVTKNTLTLEQYGVIAIVSTTVFIALDYYAPSYNITVDANILTQTDCVH
jgi:hypothetical protein